MHREWIDRSAHAAGTLQSWDPRLKVGLTVAILLALSLGARAAEAASWVRLAGLGGVIIATGAAAGIPPMRWFGRSLVLLPFVAFVAVSALIAVVPGAAPGIPIGGWTITAAEGGGEHALRILARAWLSILVTLLLALTTPLPAILAALERWHLPRGLLEVCALVYRYLWVLLEEGRRLLLARRLRAGGRASWRSGGRIIAALFARSLARAHRIEIALRLRGYRGSLPLGRPLAWSAGDSLRLLIAVGLLVAAVTLPVWVVPVGGGGTG